MDILTAYTRFLLKTNRNFKSNNVTADKPRFVQIYNEEQVRRVNFILDNKNDDDIREIQELIVSQADLGTGTKKGDRYEFNLPEDFMEYSSAYAKVSTKKCKDIKVNLWEFKDFNYSEVIGDKNATSSLEFREAPMTISGGKVQVFDEGFSVDKIYLTYYRYPKDIDIEGYIKIDGSTTSTNVDPELDNEFIDKVISMCAESYFRQYGDPNQVQINKERILNDH